MAKPHKTVVQDCVIDPCPFDDCGQRHVFHLLVSIPVETVVLFGGGDRLEKLMSFTCPNTQKSFKKSIPNPPDGEILRVATEEEKIANSLTGQESESEPSKADWVDKEFSEWIKHSSTKAIDFCEKMISTSTGAIPIYFAILKYLSSADSATAEGAGIAQISIAPPVLYLMALVIFAIALRPKFGAVSKEDFVFFRSLRLQQMNRFMIAGTFTFVLATGISTIVFFSVLG